MAWGYLLPVAYAGTAYILLWGSGVAPPNFAGFVQVSQNSLQIETGAAGLNATLIMSFGVLQSAVSATGEEIGWRGFLVPALAQRHTFTVVALVSGVIWAVWHYPLILFGTYNSAAPKWVALICFTIMIVATMKAVPRRGSIPLWNM